MVRAVLADQLRQRLLTRRIGRPCRHLVSLEGIEVAATRHIRIADRVAARPRRDESAGQSCQQCFQFLRIGKLSVQFDAPVDQLTQFGRLDRLHGHAIPEITLQGSVRQ